MYIQHLVLRVRDIEVAHDFYTRVLGFQQCAALEPERFPDYKMRFYRGDETRHHDLALAELLDPSSAPPPESPWSMFGRTPGIDHFAVCYPDRESWLNQIAWMQSQGVEFRVRGNHGMTHSAYVEDPDGNGVEVLYNLPEDVWAGDVNAALNHFDVLPNEGPESLVDDTDYVKFEPAGR
jgi:catechol 2,3-dioxygenase